MENGTDNTNNIDNINNIDNTNNIDNINNIAKNSGKTLYLAGPLFTVAEKIHNQRLYSALKRLGYQVILPQIDCAVYSDRNEDLDIDHLQTAKKCLQSVHECDILIASIEGPDGDSGTCIELGIAIEARKPTIILRTDSRREDIKISEDVNSMMLLADRIIYATVYPEDLATIKPGDETLYDEIASSISDDIPLIEKMRALRQ